MLETKKKILLILRLEGGDIIMSTKKLSDLGIQAQEYESTALSTVNGKKLIVISTEFKMLGQYDGVVLTLEEPVTAVDGSKWDKVHSSSFRLVSKFKSEEVQNSLRDGTLEMTVISGKTGKGTWYDVE